MAVRIVLGSKIYSECKYVIKTMIYHCPMGNGVGKNVCYIS